MKTATNIRSKLRPRGQMLFLAAALGLLSQLLAARGEHIPTSLDRAGLRTKLPNEGYLEYKVNPERGRFGDEWTGWVDVRHPALGGARDTNFGYDRSDHFSNVHSKIVTANDNIPPQAAMPNIPRDFDFANKIYLLQSGLSVLSIAETPVAQNVRSPLSDADQNTVFSTNRAPAPAAGNPQSINNWYVGSIGGTNAGARGQAGGPHRADHGTMIADSAVSDTFAHEVGHFLTDERAIHQENAAPDQAHSGDDRNLLAGGGIRWHPGLNQNGLGAGNPPFDIANGIAVIGPAMSTNPNGSPLVGGVDQLTTTPDNPAGGFPANQSQVQRIYAAAGGANGNPAEPFVRTNDRDLAGNRVDWDFVTDHAALENIPNRADNHQGIDSLFWGIGTTTAPTHPAPDASNGGHDHTGLGQFPATPDFAGPSFRTVDVFSLSPRYSDSDINALGNLSLREGALDYDLLFRGADGTVVAGVVVEVFTGGWTNDTLVDNFLARWVSPIPATGVFVLAHAGNGHDGTAQIDALIASPDAIPEPASVVLFGVGTLCVAGYKWRRRRRATKSAAQ